MGFTKRVSEINKCNDHRALFYPGFVDGMCHLSCMLKRTRELRHENSLTAMFNIPISRQKCKQSHANMKKIIFRGVHSRVIGLKFVGSD